MQKYLIVNKEITRGTMGSHLDRTNERDIDLHECIGVDGYNSLCGRNIHILDRSRLCSRDVRTLGATKPDVRGIVDADEARPS